MNLHYKLLSLLYKSMAYLHTMYCQTRTSKQLFMTNKTFKMLCLLMLNQDFLIIKYAVTIPTPRFNWSLLFTTH